MSVDVFDENGEVVRETRPAWTKRRYLLVLLAFFGFINIYTLRFNLSVGIVAMTENKTVLHDNGTHTWTTYEREFDWSTKQQGLVLSSFFYGYICTQFIGGYVATRIGGSLVLGLGIFSTAVLTLILPVAAKAGIGMVVALRVLMGFAEGVTIPCMHGIWSKWAPPLERTRMAGITVAGQYMGAVIAMSTCGVLAQKYGWESVFYVYGAIGCVWYVFWAWLVRESPEKESRMSDEERRYIMVSLKHTANTKPQTVPWKELFSSAAVWAIVASHFSENWGVYTLLTQLPLYMKHNLNFDLANSGFIAAVPYLGFGIILFFAGPLADWLQAKGYLTTTRTRKLFNSTAFVSQTIFLMLAAFNRDRISIIVFITFGGSLGALSICGYGVNHLDIAPQFASILMGLSNTVATIPGIVSPLLAGVIVQQQDNPEQWKWVFILNSCIFLFGCIVFFIFSTGERQSWAKLPKNDIDDKKTEEENDKKKEAEYDTKF